MKDRKDYPILKSIVPEASGGGDAIDAMRRAARRARAEGTAISLQFAKIIERMIEAHAIPEYSDQPEEVVDEVEEAEVLPPLREAEPMLLMSPAQLKAYRELGYDQPVEERIEEVEGEM